MLEKRLSGLRRAYPKPERSRTRLPLLEAQRQNPVKIVVLDDDPTGIQTVHDVSVYTDWSAESVLAGFREDAPMFFILTNSRSFTAEETRRVHAEIARHIDEAARQTRKAFLLVSRGDSTLRGHWPLESQTLRETLESLSGRKIDGEILLPFFQEGGRYTAGDVHYVADGDTLVPVGETEFAKDATFGFSSSNLREWVEEKTAGRVARGDVCSVGLEELRACDVEGIERRLLRVHDFGKVVVNALDTCDVEVFCTALLRAFGRGRRFILRTAAAVPKVLGGVPDRPLLTRAEMETRDTDAGGLIVVGSHVKKTGEQLAELQKCGFVHFVEFNQHLVLQPDRFENEIARVAAECEAHLRKGETVAVYTSRKVLQLDTADKEAQLKISVKISGAVTRIVESLRVCPSFIVAKGGITSSDIGVRGLHVKKALVLGQLLPGIPVWKTGEESRFPGIPYIIFPGNVGGRTALRDAVCILTGREAAQAAD